MMNHGNSESESQFYSAIARVSVAQICQSVGFKKAQNCALGSLTDIAGRYILAIANSASVSANSGGRTECNLADIVGALEDLGSIQGFFGAQESHCLMSSSVLKEIMRFVHWNDESPFAKAIPKRSISPEVRKSGNGNQMGLSHVPRWLPEMPEISGSGLALNMGAGREEEKHGGDFGEEKMKVRNEGSELPEKRRKVKIRMGMGIAGGIGNKESSEMELGVRKSSGVFSRSGNGKRILCQGWNEE